MNTIICKGLTLQGIYGRKMDNWHQMSYMPMLEKAAGLFRALSGDVCVTVSGEQLWLPGEQAITLVITASELMINAKKHAFAGRSGGTICLSLQNGNAVATLTVSDDGMSAYLVYNAYSGIPESRRTVVSNIHKDGISAVEAGAYIADVIEKMLEQKTSGVDLKKG